MYAAEFPPTFARTAERCWAATSAAFAARVAKKAMKEITIA
jgi:hypothetical protein